MRLFVAVAVPEPLKKRLIKASMELSAFGVRPVGENQMHITIAFMGSVDPKRIDDVIAALHSIGHKKFDCSISGIGTFNGKVVFAKVESGYGDLRGMHEEFSKSLANGIKIDNKGYSPHLTLGRATPKTEIEKMLRFVQSNSGLEFGSFACNEIRLYSSEETPSGHMHREITSRMLG